MKGLGTTTGELKGLFEERSLEQSPKGRPLGFHSIIHCSLCIPLLYMI